MKECLKHGLTEHVLLPNGSYKCKECRKQAVVDIRRKNKIKLVEYKGGKCEICGYDKCIDALEFHHLNPKEKSFGLSCGESKSLEKLKKEADKCILVCSNCHREIHAKEKEEIRNKKLEVLLNNYQDNIYKFKSKLNIDLIKEDITNKLSKKEIANKYSVSLTMLNKFLKDNDIDYCKTKSGKLKDLTIDEFCNLFKNLGTFTLVAKKLNVCDKSLVKWCIRNNLPWRKKELTEFINKI